MEKQKQFFKSNQRKRHFPDCGLYKLQITFVLSDFYIFIRNM